MNVRSIVLFLVITIQMLVTAVAPTPAFANSVGSHCVAANLSSDGIPITSQQEDRDLELFRKFFRGYQFLPYIAPDPEGEGSGIVC